MRSEYGVTQRDRMSLTRLTRQAKQLYPTLAPLTPAQFQSPKVWHNLWQLEVSYHSSH